MSTNTTEKVIRAKRTSETVYNEVLAVEERKEWLEKYLSEVEGDTLLHSPMFATKEAELNYGAQTLMQLGKRSESLTNEYTAVKEKEAVKAAKDTMSAEDKAKAKLEKQISKTEERLAALRAAASGAAASGEAATPQPA
mgnify:CR=1 FL=1